MYLDHALTQESWIVGERTTLLKHVDKLTRDLAEERRRRQEVEAQLLDLDNSSCLCSCGCEQEKQNLTSELHVLQQRLKISTKARDLLQAEAAQLEQQNLDLRRQLRPEKPTSLTSRP